MASSKRAIQHTKVLERRSKALELRLEGKSLRAIAEKLDISLTQCHADIEAAIQANRSESLSEIETAIQLELSRLDYYLSCLAERIDRGDEKAINTAVRISERRCKLLGLDAPIRLEVETLVNQELEAFISALSQRLPQETFIEVLQVISALQGSKTHA